MSTEPTSPPVEGAAHFVRAAFSNVSFVTGFAITVLIAAMALVSFMWTPYDITLISIADKQLTPSVQHLFGTDHSAATSCR